MRRQVRDRPPTEFARDRYGADRGNNGPDALDMLARAVSRFTYPTFFCVPVFLVLSSSFLPWPAWPATFFLCAFFATLLPMAAVLAWMKRAGQDDLDVPRRESRKVPLVLSVLSYLLGTVALAAMSSPPILTGLMFCYFSNTLLVFLINLRWKISIHSIGVAGPTVAMVFAFGYPGLVPGLLIPLIMWSRVRLKQHTVAQVVLGAGLGILSTTVQLSMFL